MNNENDENSPAPKPGQAASSGVDDSELENDFSGETKHSDSDNNKDNQNKSAVDRLAKDETKAIRQFRLLLLLVLFVFAVAIAFLVYYFMERVEYNEFQKEFHSNGNKVITAFSEDSYRKMQALFSLSSSWTAHAMHTNSTWPFVTIPHSAQELAPYLSLADAAALTIFPIVPSHLRAEWETYAVQNQHWIDVDLESRGNRNFWNEGAGLQDNTISPYIKNYVGVDTSPGVWLPWWQYYPVIPNRWFVNFNRLAWKGFSEQLQILLQAKATLSETITYVPGLDYQSTRDFTFFDQLLRAGGSGHYNPGEPLSYIFYPILEHFGSNEVVAVLSATVYWKSYFQGILPEDAQGIVCVVRNSAGQAFTFQVNGLSADFLGMEDLHDHQFDRMRLSTDYSSFGSGTTASNGGSAEYTGLEVDDEQMSYHLDVYPSASLQDNHSTNKPIYFALAMAAVFVVCAIIFAVYNMLVERRQRLVMTTAVKSTTVVESMFPSNVRDRLMADVTVPDSTMGTGTAKDTFPGKSVASAWGAKRDSHSAPEGQSSQPIADHFEACSIFFGDIKGFTAWCDTREPHQVFHLLETMYGAFDKIAKRRGVYKVETVGDCYVCVAGLPKKNPRHAVLMCRFARDVMKKFFEVIQDLQAELGEGTDQLELRVGIHSGPVTAGIIRGDNARFQLFGDTVNTTARMESTGEGGRIQISENTGMLLKNEGFGGWFAPREETVFAKGKGEMQTFWLSTSPSDNRYTSSIGTGSSLNESAISADGSQLSH